MSSPPKGLHNIAVGRERTHGNFPKVPTVANSVMPQSVERTSHYVPYTKVPTLVFPTSAQAARHVALMIESLIRQNNSAGRPTVLGLPTGSTPVGLYRELIRLHKEASLDFSRVITFNLDEYYPMKPDDAQSYRRWMQENLFNHVNIPPQSINVPDGTVSAADVEEYCMRYEQRIRRAGGIDLQVLGIGRTGHIGFNEPGSTRHSRTRMVTLDPVTRRDAASSFFGEDNVPHQALTMGVGTILDARKIVLMAFGEHKAPIVQKAVEGSVSDAVTASFLQQHPDATFLLDQAAAGQLAAVGQPWTVGPVNWTGSLIRKAVIWLGLKVKKALLKLSDDDFREHELYELLREHGPANALGRRVFDEMMATLCTQPAGAASRTVLIFSPHPDDDVISMGGTLIRLVQQQHKVHVAYMTSGNIAVFDHDAWRFTDYVVEFNRLFDINEEQTLCVKERVQSFLRSKTPGQPDSEDLLRIKSLIRTTEARAAALACGVPPEQLEFMDLRFYRTGTIAKAPIHPQDIADIASLLAALAAGPDLRGRRAVRSARHAPRLCRGHLRGCAASASRRTGLRGLALSRRLGGVGAARDRAGGAAQPGRPGTQETGASSATNRRRTGPCSPAAPTAANSGSGPRTATATPLPCTTSSACRSSTPWKASSSGATSRFEESVTGKGCAIPDSKPSSGNLRGGAGHGWLGCGLPDDTAEPGRGGSAPACRTEHCCVWSGCVCQLSPGR